MRTKKYIKFYISILSCIFIVVAIFIGSKENPRVYLNNNFNIAYINENFNTKISKLNEEFGLEEKIGDNIVYNSIKKIKNIYFLSEEDLNQKNRNWIAVIDYGYIYPFVSLKINDFFEKSDSFYSLKGKYANKYFKGKKIYLKVIRGNFILGFKKRKIDDFLKKERYIDARFVRILEKERKNKLGIEVINLYKNVIGGFEEFLVSGDFKQNKVIIKIDIRGKNSMIKNFSLSKSLKDENIIIEKNQIYFRSNSISELKKFLFFMNYFLNEEIIKLLTSRITLKKTERKYNKDINEEVKFEENQFLYSKIDTKDNFQKMELKGKAFDEKVEILIEMDSDVLFKNLNLYLGGKNDKNI